MANLSHIRGAISGPLDHAERDVINALITRVNALYNPPHASMWFQDQSLTLAMDQNTWAQITNGTHDLFTSDPTGMTVTNDTLVIITAGDYLINASLSYAGTTNADVYEFAAFVNGELASPKIERSTTSLMIGNVGLPFYLEDLVADDVIDLRLRNTANDFDPTLVSCSWVTWLLHY